MNKIVVEFNKEKAAEKNVTMEELMRKTDIVFEKCDFVKEKNGVYYSKDDFDFMVVVGVLVDLEWFTSFISKWDWYEDGVGPIDIMERFEI